MVSLLKFTYHAAKYTLPVLDDRAKLEELLKGGRRKGGESGERESSSISVRSLEIGRIRDTGIKARKDRRQKTEERREKREGRGEKRAREAVVIARGKNKTAGAPVILLKMFGCTMRHDRQKGVQLA